MENDINKLKQFLREEYFIKDPKKDSKEYLEIKRFELFFNNFLKPYLEYTYQNLLYDFSFYFRVNKVNFLEYYYCLNITNSKATYSLSKPVSDLQKEKMIILEGTAGSGKTSIAKYSFLQAITEGRKIPVFISLKDLNDFYIPDSYSYNIIKSFIIKSIQKIIENNSAHDKWVEYIFLKGDFFLIFDGFDEVNSRIEKRILDDLKAFNFKYNKNIILITTRPGTSVSLISKRGTYKVSSLDEKDIAPFVKKLKKDKKADSIIKTLQDPKSEYYRDILKNPLLLSMFVLTYESYPEIPTKRSEFYENVFSTLYGTHKTSQGILNPERRSNFSYAEFKKAMSALSFILYMNNMYDLTDITLFKYISRLKDSKLFIEKDFVEEDLYYDLITSISILIKDGTKIYYPHRSIQEYFTALFITNQMDNNKKSAYSRLRTDKINKGTDDLANLFDLLQEMDPIGIKKYFVIGGLKSIVSDLENLIEDVAIENFVEQYSSIFSATARTHNKQNFTKINITFSSSRFENALEYLGNKSSSMSKVRDILQISDLEKKISQHIEKISNDAYNCVFTPLNSISYQFTKEGHAVKFSSLFEVSLKHASINQVVINHFKKINIIEKFIAFLNEDINQGLTELEIQYKDHNSIINLNL
tara:strand:- start:262210 stop:264138 length:1929 start_codon:yes stop_codon:yes gene_type:complete